ncbi:MAG: hypothetical protein OXI92_03950 [Acidobacteriota bacterium]|nr:hypothetical protein [Acidobacteriota bacterium]
MSNDLETLKRHTAELQAALNGISDSAAAIAHFRTELEHALRVLRQANHATEPLRRGRRRAELLLKVLSFGWALVGAILGGFVSAWITVQFLGR